MAVHKYQRKDGVTVYAACFRAPDGSRRVVLIGQAGEAPAGASKREHERARTAAKAHANDQRRAVRAGTWIDPDAEKAEAERDALTFGDFVDRFLEDYRPRSGDLRYYRQRGDLWKVHFGKATPVLTIAVSNVDAFRKAREAVKVGRGESVRPLSPSTIRKDLVSLGTLFRWGRARGLVRDNPADSDLVRRPPEPVHRDAYLTEDEERDYIKAARGWARPLIAWAVNTGMDRGEILGLEARDLDFKAKVIHATRSKTSVSRKIPFNAPIGEILAEALKVRQLRPDSPERVFLGPDGKPFDLDDDNAADRELERAYSTAGITKGAPWKILRHTFGTRLAERGATGPQIQYLMGHRSLTTSGRYISIQAEHVRETMALLVSRNCTKTTQRRQRRDQKTA